MRPKPGSRPNSKMDTPGPSAPRPITPDNRPNDSVFHPPGRLSPGSSNTISAGVSADSPIAGTTHQGATVTVTPMPDLVAPRPAVTTSPLEPYVLNVGNHLPAPAADGLRAYNGRQFADVTSDDPDTAIQTVMVMYHAPMKAYRAKSLSKRDLWGPPLYRIADSNAWSLKKPSEYFDIRQHTISQLPDHDGYYSVRRHSEADPNLFYPGTGYAFRDEKQRWVKVDPREARGDRSVTVKLEQWTDGDIWRMYRLQGAEAWVFRNEAQVSGTAPDWARRFKGVKAHDYLIDSLGWLYPQMSASERAQWLRSYNLTVAQQIRLRQELESGPFPEWAEQHKRLTQNKDDNQRFNLIAQELEPYLLKLRNHGFEYVKELPPAQQRYEAEFLKNYTDHAGYQRNVHLALYRTDIPAMFRGDHRTPFELARDKRMVRLKGNPSGITTKWALSATFSLGKALWYKSELGGYSHPLHYNSQANRYPGKISDGDISPGSRDGSDAESDTSFELDYSKDYPLVRRQQTQGFLYVIDTRGIEVVPGAENLYLNDLDFEADPTEGRLSMPTRGISAQRLWLVNSQLTRAACVEDVFKCAGGSVSAIEKATWNGTLTYSEQGTTIYDALIDRVGADGAKVLFLPKGRDTFAGDITWPTPEHERP